MSGEVWLPESSLADEKVTGELTQVAGVKEKQKKAKIVKRTVPTVEIRSLPSGGNVDRKQYSTIERSRYNKNSVLLNLNAPSETDHKNAEFCGWETERGTRIGLCQSSSTFRKCVTTERKSLSTPVDGYRSGLQSRACSRAGGNRRGDYQFKHLTDTRAYLEDYCLHCSSSALGETIREAGNEAEVCAAHSGRRREGLGSTGHPVQNGGRGNQLYLQQLARRLGVGAINEKQLRYRPQPTPPSITKRNRIAADLLVTTQEEKPTSQEDSTLNHKAISEEQAGAVYAKQSRPSTRATTAVDTLELPRVLTKHRTTNKNNKTLSTSSVVKYLNISSGAHRTTSLGLGEEESAVDISPHGSVGDPLLSSSNVLEEVEPSKKDESEVCSAVGKSSCRECESSPFDDAWRDRILTQKAHALGLLSRDRVRASLMTRINSEQNGTRAGGISHPHTRADIRHHTKTRTDTVTYRQQHSSLDQSRKEERKGDYTEHLRPKTSQDKISTSGRKSKLKKMKAIYEPSTCKRSCSRQQQHRCGTALSKRPLTRGGDDGQREESKDILRPGTKSRKRLHFPARHKPGLESEESQYWNEVPNIDHLRSRFHRPHPRAVPDSIPASDDSSRVERVKYCSNACKISRPPLAVELSGHHYRHTHNAHLTHKPTTFRSIK